MSSTIINKIKNITTLSYLELGVDDNRNFDSIQSVSKMSVDINSKAIFTGTTDQFFAQNKNSYDIIYIDANHDLDFVQRDYNNAISVCKKLLLIHDMYPPSEMYTESRYCSDSFKLLAHFSDNGFDFMTLDSDFGLTFIFPKFKPAHEVKHISYQQFLDKKIPVYTEDEIVKRIQLIG